MAFARPAAADDIPENERSERVRIDTDLCVVDDEHHFIRGVIEIPVNGQPETLGIGVWVSQKSENFDAYVAHFDSAEIGPFFGWLSNDFTFGGEPSLNLKTMAHFRGRGLRPKIELEPTNHPLAVAQRDGLSLDEAWAFLHESLDQEAT